MPGFARAHVIHDLLHAPIRCVPVDRTTWIDERLQLAHVQMLGDGVHDGLAGDDHILLHELVELFRRKVVGPRPEMLVDVFFGQNFVSAMACRHIPHHLQSTNHIRRALARIKKGFLDRIPKEEVPMVEW